MGNRRLSYRWSANFDEAARSRDVVVIEGRTGFILNAEQGAVVLQNRLHDRGGVECNTVYRLNGITGRASFRPRGYCLEKQTINWY